MHEDGGGEVHGFAEEQGGEQAGAAGIADADGGGRVAVVRGQQLRDRIGHAHRAQAQIGHVVDPLAGAAEETQLAVFHDIAPERDQRRAGRDQPPHPDERGVIAAGAVQHHQRQRVALARGQIGIGIAAALVFLDPRFLRNVALGRAALCHRCCVQMWFSPRCARRHSFPPLPGRAQASSTRGKVKNREGR